MRKVVVALIFLLLLLPFSGATSVRYVPYVYDPIIPATALSVLALYRVGDYQHALEGAMWLEELKTPDSSWAYQYGMKPQPKYTALALMALIRSESLAHGLFNKTINLAAYWLIYVQKDNGSFGDYVDTALSVLALKEYTRSRWKVFTVEKGLKRGLEYLQAVEPKTTTARIFRDIALGNLRDLRSINATGVDTLYRAFGIAYLTGGTVNVTSHFNDPASVALMLYATKSQVYHRELLDELHFGFWGRLKYQPPDLLEAATLPGFSDLKSAACPVMLGLHPRLEWERVVLARYYVECNQSVDFSNINFEKLKPWMVAEIARINNLLGRPYEVEINYLLKNESDNHWGNFFDTAYVIWVLSNLNVNLNYKPVLEWLAANLTMKYPNYYYAYALVDFYRFNYTEAFNETLSILLKNQNPNGGWGYNKGAPSNVKSTATVLRAFLQVGLNKSKAYQRGISFLRNFLYARIPLLKRSKEIVSVPNATFILIRNSTYIGNRTNETSVEDLDGYLVVYPKVHPLEILALSVNGFKVGLNPFLPEEKKGSPRWWLVFPILAVAVSLAILGLRRRDQAKDRKSKKVKKSRRR